MVFRWRLSGEHQPHCFLQGWPEFQPSNVGGALKTGLLDCGFAAAERSECASDRELRGRPRKTAAAADLPLRFKRTESPAVDGLIDSAFDHRKLSIGGAYGRWAWVRHSNRYCRRPFCKRPVGPKANWCSRPIPDLRWLNCTATKVSCGSMRARCERRLGAPTRLLRTRQIAVPLSRQRLKKSHPTFGMGWPSL
jgi:hypothetical protein